MCTPQYCFLYVTINLGVQIRQGVYGIIRFKPYLILSLNTFISRINPESFIENFIDQFHYKRSISDQFPRRGAVVIRTLLVWRTFSRHSPPVSDKYRDISCR